MISPCVCVFVCSNPNLFPLIGGTFPIKMIGQKDKHINSPSYDGLFISFSIHNVYWCFWCFCFQTQHLYLRMIKKFPNQIGFGSMCVKSFLKCFQASISHSFTIFSPSFCFHLGFSTMTPTLFASTRLHATLRLSQAGGRDPQGRTTHVPRANQKDLFLA